MGHANIINFQVQSQFQIFLNKLCVCFLTQMKDIRQGFHSVTWGFGVGGGGGSKIKFSEHGHVAYQIKGDDQ